MFDKGGPVFGTTGGSAGVICPVELGDPYILMGLLGYYAGCSSWRGSTG